MHTFVANFLGYATTKNYRNWIIFSQVFAKVKRMTFFSKHSVDEELLTETSRRRFSWFAAQRLRARSRDIAVSSRRSAPYRGQVPGTAAMTTVVHAVGRRVPPRRPSSRRRAVTVTGSGWSSPVELPLATVSRPRTSSRLPRSTARCSTSLPRCVQDTSPDPA